MKESDLFNTGVIEREKGSAVFINDNYSFNFLNALSKKPDMYDRDKAFCLSLPADGFLKGVTHNGHDIAIYCGSPEEFATKEIPSTFCIHTNTYLIQCGNRSPCDWSHFEGIQFCGGTLNDLFSNIPFIKLSASGDSVTPLSSVISTPFGEITVTIGTISQERRSRGEYTLSNRTVYIKLLFAESITIADIFPHLDNVSKFISFLTNHKNIGFDEIYLLKWNKKYHTAFNDVQIFQESYHEFVQKSPWSNICFDDLNDFLFPLLQLVYSRSPHNPFCFMDFFPASSRDVGRMSTDLIHSIVTCLECELSRTKAISSPSDDKNTAYIAESEKLFSLVTELKKAVQTYEKENGSFSKKTHDMLMGTLKHLSLADADKINLLYDKYKHFLSVLFSDYNFTLEQSDIEALIIHRNRTTHGVQQILDNRLAMTAFYLIGLIYCMILHSVGIDDPQLKKICEKHFLSK